MGRKSKSRTSNIRQNKNTLKWMQVTYALRHFYSSFKPSPSLHLVVYHHNPTRRWIYIAQVYYLCNPAVTHWWWRSTTVPGAKLCPTHASVKTNTLTHRMLILKLTYFLKKKCINFLIILVCVLGENVPKVIPFYRLLYGSFNVSAVNDLNPLLSQSRLCLWVN